MNQEERKGMFLTDSACCGIRTRSTYPLKCRRARGHRRKPTHATVSIHGGRGGCVGRGYVGGLRGGRGGCILRIPHVTSRMMKASRSKVSKRSRPLRFVSMYNISTNDTAPLEGNMHNDFSF